MSSSPTETLEQFIEDEALHYPKGAQDPCFPSNRKLGYTNYAFRGNSYRDHVLAKQLRDLPLSPA
jgi:hypothetical protein